MMSTFLRDLRAVRTTTDLVALCATMAAQNGDPANAPTQSEEAAARALAAAPALVAYAGESYEDIDAAVNDVESFFADVMTDLKHLADAFGVDWDAVSSRSDGYHRTEATDLP